MLEQNCEAKTGQYLGGHIFWEAKMERVKMGRWRRQAPAVATKYTAAAAAGIYSPDIGNTDTG